LVQNHLKIEVKSIFKYYSIFYKTQAFFEMIAKQQDRKIYSGIEIELKKLTNSLYWYNQ